MASPTTAKPITPPPLHAPTAKEKKYDRQLRLWAASGQQALEEARVLLLNSGSGVVGIEALKNLVLPGVGEFTIVDENAVCEEDLGVNFFLEEESLGKGRADEGVRLLRELNPEVGGKGVRKSIKEFVEEQGLGGYTLVLLAAPVSREVLMKVSDSAWQLGIPLVHVHSAGFYADFAIQLAPLFPIVDTHPDPSSTQDLRLLAPWGELVEYARVQTKGLEQLSDHDHGHVPYLLLLLHYLDKWKEEHGGKYPENYKEKDALRSAVREGARTNNSEGGEENYDEAVGAVLKSLNPPSIPSGLKEIFAEAECQNPQTSSANFWIIAHAISSFVTANGVLPLPGAIPDMKAQSKDYIALQALYRAKAQSDLTSVILSVRTLESKLGKKTPVDSKEIEAFCKGASFVKLVRGRKLSAASGKLGLGDRLGWAAREIGDEDSLLPIYIALKALDNALDRVESITREQDLLAKFNSEPFVAQMESCQEAILLTLSESTPEFDLEGVQERLSKVAEEIQRSGPVELHNISSLTGGIVAQEIIKLITKQYVPADNTCVIDGIQSKTATFRL